jgi:hypothetical protein
LTKISKKGIFNKYKSKIKQAKYIFVYGEVSLMKKIDSILYGIASIFGFVSTMSESNVFNKYPREYETNVEKAIQKSWIKVGLAIEESINEYSKN